LIKKGAHTNLEQHPLDKLGSALAAAASGKSPVICTQILIAAGADVDQLFVHGDYGSALAAAAAQGSVEAVEVLLRSGAHVNQRLRHGLYGSALAAAAATGNAACINALLVAGADPNMQPEPGSKTILGSPLAAVAYMGEAKHVKRLIEGDAVPGQVLESEPFKTAMEAAEGGVTGREGGPKHRNSLWWLMRRSRKNEVAETLKRAIGERHEGVGEG
jgi:ankyrin repeat domain-containing protein 50